MSKRFAESQGGAARYGGEERDTPEETPRKATAAQLAKRNIKPLKRGGASSSRSTSPSKMGAPPMNNAFGAPQPQSFGGFGAAPSSAPQQQQQQGMFGSGSFGGPQQQSGPTPPSSSSFTFGAAAPVSNPFANSAQSQSFGGFSAPQSTPSFSPPKTDFSFGGPPPASNGVFSFGATTPAKPAEPTKPATNGTPAFGGLSSGNMFGQTAQAAALTDAEIGEIEGGGSRLTADQMGQLEKIVRDSDSKYQNATSLAGLNLRQLPLDAQKKMLAFVRDPSGATNKPSQTPSFGTTTPAATPSNPFASLSRPAEESTPKPATTFGATPSTSASTPFKGFGAPPASTSSFGAPAASTTELTETVSYPDLNGAASQADSPASSTPKVDFTKPETPKPASNGFTSFNSTPAKGLGASMFNSAPGQSAASSPFKFGSTDSSSQNKDATQPSQPSASTPFKFGSTDSSSQNKDAAQPSQSAASTPFKFGNTASSSQNKEAAPSATPFKFGNPTPAPPAAATPNSAAPSASTRKPELFTTAPTPPATSETPKFGGSVSAQKLTASAPSFGGFAAPASKPSSSPAPSSFAPKPASANQLAPPTTASNPSSSTNTSPSAVRPSKLRELNEGLRKHLASQNLDYDWSNIVRYYLEEANKICTQQEPVKSAPAQSGVSNGVSAAPAMQKRKADDEASRDDGNKRSKAGTTDFSQSLSASSPNKPLTQTASLFNDILNTPTAEKTPAKAPATAPPAPAFAASTPIPDKVTAPPAETPKANPFATLTKVNNTPAAPPATTPKPATGGFQFKPATASDASPAPQDKSQVKPASTAPASSPFKFNPTTASSTSSAPATSGFSLPKFGGGNATGTPNFLSAFGAKAADEEKKEREKRKMEDLDSDDDEDEWEKKDAEEQAAKRKKMLEDAANAAKPSFKPFTPSASSASVFKFGGEASKSAPTPAPASSAGNIFGHLSSAKDQAAEQEEEESDEDADADETATPEKPAAASSQSLFSRIEKPADSSKPAAASTPFKFGGASSNTNIFGSAASPAGDNTWKGDSSTPVKFSNPTADGSATPAGSPAKNAFGGLAGTATAPPKFGGFRATSIHDKPAPKFGGFGQSTSAAPSANLFGASSKPLDTKKPASSSSGGLNASIFSPASKPSAGFSFGTPGPGAAASAAASNTSSVFGNSNATSRASTPVTAANTDGEASSGNDANEPSDEVKDTPQNDLTALTASEIATNDLVFESKSKASKFEEKDGQKGWQGKGLGIFRLLKNKETGKHWGLMRMTPGGQIMLQFSLLKKSVEGAYVANGKLCRMLVADDAGKMETWGLQFGTVEKVKDLVGLLQAGQPE